MENKQQLKKEFVELMQGGNAINVYDWEKIADWFLERTIPKEDGISGQYLTNKDSKLPDWNRCDCECEHCISIIRV